ncbi:MAG: PAS domain S-box protein [Candidatus Riflebacteria bacterium]|nr:PAS domain S-box protein [Candidatus Riflebacteria bacterium]
MERDGRGTAPAQLVLVTAIIVLLSFSTHLSSSLVDVLQAGILVLLFGYVVILGRRFPVLWQRGWAYIIIGFNLITFGGIVDVSQYVPFLQSPLTATSGRFRGLLVQVLGKMAGPLLVAYGFYRWVPSFLESRVVLERIADQLQMELKTQAEALQQARKLLELESLNRTVVQTVPLGLMATDPSGSIVHANHALEELTGIPISTMVGAKVEDVFKGMPLGEIVSRAKDQGQETSAAFEVLQVLLPKGQRDLRVTSTRSGERLLVCVIEDITARVASAQARKQYQDQLLKNEKLSSLGSLISGVAHELNNPLSVITGYAELLTRRPPTPTLVEKALIEIQRSAVRCQKIVASLLTFSRQHAPERKLVLIQEILDEAVQLRAYQCRVHDIEVVRNYEFTPPTMADGHQLLQVFFNLINNAYQALQGHGGSRQLTVTCRADDELGRSRARCSIRSSRPSRSASGPAWGSRSATAS